ncbi:hypothetical protein KP509_26G020500 [Ceratopteris richardii]|uniref:Uncharacterized protein n=1 Tax=Ceratopteris richardii TaxID=49495 RepID=A0A8T2RIZ4_CERRI|nr:hypothetical protein KP509_26G020500 [Ceratopteris richardii]
MDAEVMRLQPVWKHLILLERDSLGHQGKTCANAFDSSKYLQQSFVLISGQSLLIPSSHLRPQTIMHETQVHHS